MNEQEVLIRITAIAILYQAAVATGEAGWGTTILQSAMAHLDGTNDHPGTVEAWSEERQKEKTMIHLQDETCEECGVKLLRRGSESPLECPQCGGLVCEECHYPIGQGSFVASFGNSVICTNCAITQNL